VGGGRRRIPKRKVNREMFTPKGFTEKQLKEREIRSFSNMVEFYWEELVKVLKCTMPTQVFTLSEFRNLKHRGIIRKVLIGPIEPSD
jgi:peroxiredoxin family protein